MGDRRMLGLAWSLVLVAAAPPLRALPIEARGGLPVVLQVPYVAQSELLCGGAALAMVERWWGRRGVQAEEFASLMSPARGGILTTDLVGAARSRGWRTAEVVGTATVVQHALQDSVPVLALIAVGPERYHYVVIVGWDADQVTYHDPAVRPFVRLATAAFLARWDGADRWAMLLRPAPPDEAPTWLTDLPSGAPIDSLPCRPWLDAAIDAAAVNRFEEAATLLETATTACPAEPLVLRELAGLRFREGRHAESTVLAATYVARVPGDLLGWQLLASGRYRAGDASGALAAWNRIGRPTTDLVRIDGSEQVRYRTLLDAVDVEPGTMLTPRRLALAQRRVADIPALALARVSYVAVAGGAVELRAAVVERPVFDPLPQQLVAGAVRAVTRREVGLSTASPLGAGERWTALWRWEVANPRRALRVEMPAHLVLPGILSLEGSWEQYRFDTGLLAPSVPVATRRTTTLGYRSWVSGSVETLTGVRLERWASEGDLLALSIGGALHGSNDRLLLTAQGERAVALSEAPGYGRVRVGAAWWSMPDGAGVTWSARVGTDWISGGAPRGLWPIAGGDLARAIPLRAHPLIVDHRLPAARTGQTIVHGGVAGDHHLATIGPVTLAAGLFLDGADVIATEEDVMRHRRYLDGGAGVRVGMASAPGMQLRIDLARGLLTDHRWGLTVGLAQPWPHRPRPLH
jgi:hypothetical protein